MSDFVRFIFIPMEGEENESKKSSFMSIISFDSTHRWMRYDPSSTFLPQVWKQLQQPEMFLSQLCLKAGLSSDTWQKAGLEVKTYQVQYFEENK